MVTADVVLRGIGGNLRAERSRRGLTQEGLAHVAGLGVAQVARMERGEVDAGVGKWVRVAAVLGVSTCELLHVEWPGDPHPS